ncbi:MAG TPA: hypothetical protein VGW57_13735 [Chthoniobacterales bacterium]|nr:hypothetical protein [Chthoniobacterales bacterium]
MISSNTRRWFVILIAALLWTHKPACAYPTGDMGCEDIGEFAGAVVIGKGNGQTMKQALAKVNTATAGHPIERKNMTAIVRAIYTWAKGMSEEGAKMSFMAECVAQDDAPKRARVEMSEDEIKATASLIGILEKSGHLRLECAAGKAWIDTHDWQEYSIFEKEKMTHVVCLACADRSEVVSRSQAIVLYDLQSDKKLATYSSIAGFRIY